MLRDIAGVLFRHRWRVIIILATVPTTVAIATFLSPRIYRSDARLMLRIGRESVALVPGGGDGRLVMLQENREREMNSSLSILDSERLAADVVDRVGAAAILDRPSRAALADSPGECWADAEAAGRPVEDTPDPPVAPDAARPTPTESSDTERQRAIADLRGRLGFEVPSRSNIIKLWFDGYSPRVARTVLDAITEDYVERHMTVHRAAGAKGFFEAELQQAESELLASERELRDLRNSLRLGDLPAQRAALIRQRADADSEMGRARVALAAAHARLAQLEVDLRREPRTVVAETTTGVADAAADSMRIRLYELELELERVRARYGDRHPRIRELEPQVEAARTGLDGESRTLSHVRTALSTTWQALQSSVVQQRADALGLEARIEKSQRLIADRDERIVELNDLEFELAQLERTVEIRRARFLNYSQRFEQTRIDNALENQKMTNVAIIEPATCATRPIRPRVTINLLVGLFLGIFGAILAAYAGELFDDTFRTPRELESMLEATVLGALPLVPRRRERCASGPLPEAAPPEHDAIFDRIFGQLLGAGDRELPWVAVCGPNGGEGVTRTALGLADAARRAGIGRVAVVRLTSGQAPDSAPRLDAAVLARPVGEPTPPSSSAIDIFTDADARVAPLELLVDGAAALDAALAALRARYAWIVFDAAGVNVAAGVAELAGQSGATILVVAADQTRRDEVTAAMNRLEAVDARVGGVILNRRRYPIPGWIYRRI